MGVYQVWKTVVVLVLVSACLHKRVLCVFMCPNQEKGKCVIGFVLIHRC